MTREVYVDDMGDEVEVYVDGSLLVEMRRTRGEEG